MKPVLEPGVYWDSDFPTLMSWFIKKTTQGSMYGSLEECHVPSQQRRVGKVQFLLFNSPPKQTWGRWWERAIDSKKILYSLFWNSSRLMTTWYVLMATGPGQCLCVSDIKYVRHYPALVLLRHSSTISLNSAQNVSAVGYGQTPGNTD